MIILGTWQIGNSHVENAFLLNRSLRCIIQLFPHVPDSKHSTLLSTSLSYCNTTWHVSCAKSFSPNSNTIETDFVFQYVQRKNIKTLLFYLDAISHNRCLKAVYRGIRRKVAVAGYISPTSKKYMHKLFAVFQALVAPTAANLIPSVPFPFSSLMFGFFMFTTIASTVGLARDVVATSRHPLHQ